MTLDDTLCAFAHYLSLNSVDLVRYADEDNIGGFHSDETQRQFPSGSLWAVEGKTLYALIRALKPQTIVELGVNFGASTNHLRSAVQANGAGRVTSIDIWEGAGSLIRREVPGELLYLDAFDYVDELPDNSVDFVFEDMLHDEGQVRAIITALRPKLTARAIVLHHDSQHGVDGEAVRRGIEAAGVRDYLSLLAEPSDCGLAVWKAS